MATALQALKHPIDTLNHQAQQLAAGAYAKHREVSSLMSEQVHLNSLYSPYSITHPTKLSKKVNELFELYMQLSLSTKITDPQQINLQAVVQLSPVDKVSFLGQHTLNGHSLLEHMGKEIEKVKPSFIIETPSNSFFYHTDLVIYKNQYYGPLPINGIREEEFIDTNLFFNRIANSQTKVITLGSPHFKVAVTMALGKLLTRSIGRQLIKSIIEPRFKNRLANLVSWAMSHFKIFITENHQESKVKLEPDNKNSYYFDLQMNTLNNCSVFIDHPPNHLLVAENPILNECASEKIPFYICLAHELIHIRHNIQNRIWQSNDPVADQLDLYTNENEKVTISGELNNQIQDVICENSVRKAFGLYPRKYHCAHFE